MRTKILYSALFAFLLLLSSCSSFLEENPRDQINNDQIAKSPELVYLAYVASIYNEIGGQGGGNGLQGTDRGLYDLNTFTTDEAILPKRGGDWNDGGLWSDLFTHNWGTTNGLIKDTWNYLYRVIGKTNQSIDKLNSILEQEPDNVVLPPYISELRTIRAMYYYYLIDMYARVPLVTSSNVALKDVKQSERSEIFNFIVSELQEAAEGLDKSHSNKKGLYYGRMTKPVAYFLLAKMAINAEVFTDDNWTDGNRPDGSSVKFTVDGQEMNAWEATVAYCDKITALGYELSPNFEDNFVKANDLSVENIFTIPMGQEYKNEFYNLIRSRHYSHGQAYNQGGWNGASATVEALNAFAYDTNAQDPRFDLTYYYGKVEGPDGQYILQDDGTELEYVPEAVRLDVSNTPNEKTAGARMKKYELDGSATNDGKYQENDIVLFRYADVVLMKAEALVRNGQSGDTEFNMIRARVGASQDVPATLDNILDERLREFAWEGLRRQDLVRFDKFTRTYTDRPQLPNENTGFTNVFSIDTSILEANKLLTQNYGY